MGRVGRRPSDEVVHGFEGDLGAIDRDAGVGRGNRIYVATGATDMRLGFNDLFGSVRDRLECDQLSNQLYLFANARRDRMKALFFDGSGYEYAPSAWREAVCTGRRLTSPATRCS